MTFKMRPVLIAPLAAVLVAAVLVAAVQGPPPRPAEPSSEVIKLDYTECTAIHARSEVRFAVARGLLAGRITLPQAAALFGWLNRLPLFPMSRSDMQSILQRRLDLPEEFQASAHSDEAVLCLYTACYAKGVVGIECPDCAGEFSASLDDQLRRIWASGQHIVLPRVEDSAMQELLARGTDSVDANRQGHRGCEGALVAAHTSGRRREPGGKAVESLAVEWVHVP